MHSNAKNVGKVCSLLIEIVGKITINPVHAKVKVTLADAGQLYM